MKFKLFISSVLFFMTLAFVPNSQATSRVTIANVKVSKDSIDEKRYGTSQNYDYVIQKMRKSRKAAIISLIMLPLSVVTLGIGLLVLFPFAVMALKHLADASHTIDNDEKLFNDPEIESKMDLVRILVGIATIIPALILSLFLVLVLGFFLEDADEVSAIAASFGFLGVFLFFVFDLLIFKTRSKTR